MTESVPGRVGHRIDSVILLALMASYIVIAPWSSINGDFARDLTIAASIASGEEFPLKGPILASTFHLGPVWFYLLALAQWLGLGYFSIVIGLASFSALQFPLAYLAGRAWFSRAVGLTWACLLLVPSWSTYEQIMPGHTSLTSSLLLLVLVLAHRCRGRSGLTSLVLLGLAFSASLHAHPTSILAAPFIVYAWLRDCESIRDGVVRLGAICVGGVVLFLPYLTSLVMLGESPFAALSEYTRSAQGQGGLFQIPQLAATLFSQSLSYWYLIVADWPSGPVSVLTIAWSLLVGLGLVTSIISLFGKDYSSALFLISAVLGLLLIALMRNVFPFYMLTALKVITLAIVAHGLCLLWSRMSARNSVAWVSVPALLFYWSVAGPAIARQQLGEWPFAFIPLFMTTHEWQAPETLALTNALAVRQGGRFLCRFPETVLHGSWAQMQVISFGVERTLGCSAGPQILSGSDPNRDHWAGFSLAILERARIDPSSRVGNFGLVRASSVIHPAEPILAPNDLAFPPQPPLPVPTAGAESLTWSLEGTGEVLAVSNLAFGIAPRPRLRLSCGPREIEPVAEDAVSTLVVLQACSEPLQLSVSTPAAEHVDIVILESGPSTTERP